MLKMNKTLERHNHGVAYFAWSPDSTRLAVCGPEDCDEVHQMSEKPEFLKNGLCKVHFSDKNSKNFFSEICSVAFFSDLRQMVFWD